MGAYGELSHIWDGAIARYSDGRSHPLLFIGNDGLFE